MINKFNFSREYPDFVELGTLGHQIINATGPELGVCFHRPQSEMGIEKLSQPSTCGQSSGRG